MSYILTNPNPDAPLIVCDGMGVDSQAVLIALRDAGIRPDLILFADTGAEKDATYGYIAKQQAWLRRVGFPAMVQVKNNTRDTTPYDSLDGNVLANETLPSLAFGMHSCSVRWKIVPQDNYIQGVNGPANNHPGWQPALDSWAAGVKPVKVIGYDDSAADRRRAGKIHGKVHGKFKGYQFWYPLQDLGWTRADCIRAIQAEGLPVPVKSACYMCPASKKWELWWLAAVEPHNLIKALEIEYGALTGHHSRWDSINFGAWESHLSTGKDFPSKKHCGLGRSFSWCKWAYDEGVVDLDTMTVIIDPAVALARSDELRSHDNAADVRGCGAMAAADVLGEIPQVIELIPAAPRSPRESRPVLHLKKKADPRLDPTQRATRRTA